MISTPSYNFFAKLTSVNVAAGAGETRVLSAGAIGTDWAGTLRYPANSQSAGDITRVFACGNLSNANAAAGAGQARLYFNPNAALNNPIANTTLAPQIVGFPVFGMTTGFEWFFFAQFTIRTIGQNGTGYCNGYLLNVRNALDFNRMSGAGAFNIDTTQDNDLELTLTVVTQGSLSLQQCSIEYLPAP